MDLKNKLLVVNTLQNDMEENKRLINKCNRNLCYLSKNIIDHIGYDKSNFEDIIFDRPELNEKICDILIEHYVKKKLELLEVNNNIEKRLLSMFK